MRPVNQAALFVPNVFAVKADRIAFAQSVDPQGELDVMLDQDGQRW